MRSFKNWSLGCDREKSKVKVKALTLTNSRCTVKSENQSERKLNLLVYNSSFLDKNWIYYELLKIKYQKIPEMNTSQEIFKLTSQMKSRSWNLYVNGKLRTREIERNQNDRILIFKLKVIDPKSQHLTSDKGWTVLGQTSNWRVKWTRNSMNLLSTESWWKEELNENKVKWLEL